MALDKLVDSSQLDTDLTSVANAIRTKGGTSGLLAFPKGFVDAVQAIETGGGSDPVFGLIAEIPVENGVALISYDLSEVALSYGMLWAKYENVTHSSDYLYAGVVSSTGTPGDPSGYKVTSTSFNGIAALVFCPPVSAGGIALPGVRGSHYNPNSSVGGNRCTTVSGTYTFTRFVTKLYKSDSVFTGGTIKLYGRIA